MVKRKSIATAVLVVLSCLGSQSLTLAKDAESQQAKYLKQLEANVDLRKPSDNRAQSYTFLLDQSGREVMTLDYMDVRPFAEGMAAVTTNRDYLVGYIDVQGRPIIPPQFQGAGQFSEELAEVYPQSKIKGFIDLTGKQTIADQNIFDAKPFLEGLAPVRIRTNENQRDNGRTSGDNLPGKWGYINKAGKIVIAPQFDDANQFHQGRAATKLDKQWFFIDRQGVQIGEKYQAVGAFTADLAPVQVDKKWGYVAKDGKLKIAAQFDEACDYSEDLAKIKIDGKCGFIDPTGEVAIKLDYQSADHFSEGLCATQMSDGKWGFIDKLGKIAIPAIYDDAKAFFGGRALIELNDLFGYIDPLGKYVVKPKYDYAFSYSNKRAIATSKNWNHPTMRWELMGAHLMKMNVHKDGSSATSVYIPENLNDALKELDAMLPPAAKADMMLISKAEMTGYHHGLGMWLRNNWGLWKGSRLSQYLKTLGFMHPDDMTGTILDAYWSKLHGQDEDIAKQAANAKEYWEKLQPVVKASTAIPASILQMKMQKRGGKVISLNQIVQGSDVTVLTLCDQTDVLSPKIMDILDQQQSLHPARRVSLLAVLPTSRVGGTVTTIGNILKDQLIFKGDADKDRMEEKADGCQRVVGSDTLFHQFAELFKLSPLVIPQTFIINRQGVIVKRLSGFNEKTSSNLKEAIQECLGEKTK
ncbi:MAG: WG repeat-containing protein [Candidatus Melainabacteria bacterium]|nr:WG repeat-containing protein [Candidatus Melainabacteria bacterium]